MNKFASFLLGSFDGLHHGHDALFQRRTDPVGVMIIDNIPRKQVTIFSLAERIDQINYFYHPTNLFVYDVMKNNLTGAEFMNRFLKPLQIKQIIVGSNFSFGSDRLPPQKLNFACEELNIVPVQDGFSSTSIRDDLSSGDVVRANKKLLKCFFYEGIVIHGRQMSRKFNCPTANFLILHQMVKLREGVYISVSKIENNFYESVTFVGQSKLLNDPQWCVQTHLLFQNKNLYNKSIRTYFLSLISENENFTTLRQLKQKIDHDVNLTKQFFYQNPLKLNLAKWNIWDLEKK